MAYTLTYALNSDGNSYTLSGYSGDKPTGELVIPDSYDSKPVTSIGNEAFSFCTGLTSITIPNSVTSIGNSAFRGCSGLTNTTIGNGVTSIGKWAFTGCTGLTSITIPDGVTSIGERAFYNCSRLTSITIPDSVTSIGSSAFYNCRSLQYNIYDNAKYLGNSNNPYVVLIKANNTSIPLCEINEKAKFIYDSAFARCTGLTSITIPDSITSIGKGAFLGCTGLTSIIVDEGNTEYHSVGNCLIETATKTLILGCETSVIPSDGSVTSIGGAAFNELSSLTSITIPNSVTSIVSGAFFNCTGLTSITIPDSVTSIGNNTFTGCTNLTKINMFPATPPTIQSNTFTTAVQNISVPAKCRKDYITATNWNTYADKITEFPILDLGSLLLYNNKVKAKIDAIDEKKLDKNDVGSLPQPNNGTLTIQKNGTTVGTFGANQSENTTANIDVPTKVSQLQNDAGYTANKGTVISVRVNGTTYTADANGLVDLGTISGGTTYNAVYNEIY